MKHSPDFPAMRSNDEYLHQLRIKHAPTISALAGLYKTDKEIADHINMTENFVTKARKIFGIDAGRVQQKRDDEATHIALWKQSKDWSWCKAKSHLTDGGFVKLMRRLHEKGEIELPRCHVMKKKGNFFQLPQPSNKSQENAVRTSVLKRAGTERNQEFWEARMSMTPEWMRSFCETARAERLARGA